MTGEPLDRVTRSRAFELAARAGYVARGVIYILMGILALRLSNGPQNQEAPNQQGAIHELLQRPLGRVLVLTLAVGLVGYSVWRIAQAVVGRTPEQGRYRAIDRVGAVGSGIAYGLFGYIAVAAFLGRDRHTPPRHFTGDVLAWPGGAALVVVAGLVFLGVAAYQAKLAFTGDFTEYSKVHEMPEALERPFFWRGRVGHIARAVVFGMVAVFLIRTGFMRDAGETVGVDGALVRLLHHRYGGGAVALVGAGLVLFGVYSVLDARYRKV